MKSNISNGSKVSREAGAIHRVAHTTSTEHGYIATRQLMQSLQGWGLAIDTMAHSGFVWPPSGVAWESRVRLTT